MADQDVELDALRDLLQESAAIGELAKTEKPFVTAYEAFRSEDQKAFQAVLKRRRLLPLCRLVCEWIRLKECIFLCLDLCGPPTPDTKQPDPRQLAEAVVRVTSDPKVLQRLVQAVEKRDRAAFRRIAKAAEFDRFCHFFCHWVCLVRYRLVCRWVCEPEIKERPDLAAELAAAGHGLRLLLEDRAAFDQAVKASQAGDAEAFRAVIGSKQLFPFCRLICEWFCSLRCVWVCLTLCRQFPLQPIPEPLKEAFAFAQATGSLASNAGAVERLNAAVGAGDEKGFAALVTELKLERFCIQLCHWLCFLRCRRFCIPVCPPEPLFPQFTSIGVYDYLPDINSALGGNGLTLADNRAFFQTLRLNGILTQTLGGQPMEYRFETRPTDAAGNAMGPWTPVLPAQIARTEIGKWERFNFLTLHLDTKKYTVNGTAGPNELVAPISGDGWISVPQENNWLSPAGAFFANGNMIELISNSLAPFTGHDETGTIAGGPAAHALVEDAYFGIRMRVRQVGVPASETDGGTCEHVAIDNTLYENITLHPDWDGGLQPPQLAVRMLDIAELIAKPCSEITNSLTVLFTAAHPNLGSVSIVMTGPGGPFNFTLPAIPEVGDWFGTATPTFTVSSLKPCAYLVTLEITVLLTNGDDFPNPLYDQIAFCKK
jgi:hypothetical protein